MVGTRGTAPNEENPAAPDEARGTVNFKAVWSGFKAAGWTSKPPPRGIGTLWKYILPGRDANGAEGVDYLLGEQAVVNHAVQLALKERSERAAAAPPVEAAAEESPSRLAEAVGASSAASATEDPPASADTSLDASTSAQEPEDGTSSSKQPLPTRRTSSPKQTKSTKATKTTKQPKPTKTTKTTKQPKSSKVRLAKPPKPTKKPTRKSPASKSRSSSERLSPAESPPATAPSTPPTGNTDTDTQSAEAPTEADVNVGTVAQPLYDICADNGDDINTDPIGNNDYDVLDSGDEPEEEDLRELDVSDSESSASDCMDEDDEELFAKEERHFADKFLESLGGQEKVLAGDLIGPALKDLSTTGWDEPETPDIAAYLETPYQPVADTDEYPELWQGRNGPRKEAIKRGASPISLFFLFMPVAMWQHIAECSNFYMHEQLDNRVDAYFKKKEVKDRKDKAAGRAASTAKTKTRRDVRQDFLSVKPVMPHELCVYIGLLIARAIMPTERSSPITGAKMMLARFHAESSDGSWSEIALWS